MEELSKPSGISIPLLLKRKWEKQQQEQQAQDPAGPRDQDENQDIETNDGDTSNNATIGAIEIEKGSPAIWEPQLRLSLDQELTRDEKNELSNRVFTTSELEERIMTTTAVMFDIQRQLYRGEEIYYEDTYSHGSVYKGWDAFVDSASASISGGQQTTSNRRVPVDSRWFSTSCSSVSRTKPPAATFPPPLISQPVLSVAKLTSIPEQQKAETPSKMAPQPLDSVSNTETTTPAAIESNTETVHPSSTRIRQRLAASAAATSSSMTRSAEKGDTSGTSSTPKSSSRPASPTGGGRSADSGSTKKKRKTTTTTTTSEEPPFKKANQKSSSDETKRSKTASATKTATPIAGTTKGSKIDRDVSSTKGGTKNAKSEKKDAASTPGTKSNNSTPAKREKDSETPVPRKRGRPRRKT
mmetsp:Transcript_16954/g.42339  ORF Transcript_16954/g.42339 Transcript_16954/m.42339 type:complete len:412 (-) Transcript_16954:268-1503(-)